MNLFFFTPVRKIEKKKTIVSFVMSIRPFFCLFECNYSALTGRIFMKFNM